MKKRKDRFSNRFLLKHARQKLGLPLEKEEEPKQEKIIKEQNHEEDIVEYEAKPKSKERTCLKCDKKFKSSINRICDSCKRTKDHNDYFEF